MIYKTEYISPLGKILLVSDEESLLGIWFEGQKHFEYLIENEDSKNFESDILKQTKLWLDEYFAGKQPSVDRIPLNPRGSDFQKEIWNILCEIPYGEVTTYGEISKKIAAKRCLSKMSARAVGGAVGKNPISIIIPCHRVVGVNGKLTGYAGGLNKKIELLKIEKSLNKLL